MAGLQKSLIYFCICFTERERDRERERGKGVGDGKREERKKVNHESQITTVIKLIILMTDLKIIGFS